MNRKEWRVKASNGLGKIYQVLYEEEKVDKKAVILIIHGMQSHSGRNRWLAEYLAKKGYIIAFQDVQGHGRSATIPGYFGDKDGWGYIIKDVYNEVKILKKWYNLPIYIFGHSMGSFIVRDFVSRYPGEVDGMILSGTAGFSYLYYPISAMIKTDIAIHGGQYSGDKYGKMMANYFNRKIEDSEGYDDWVSSVKELRKAHREDKLSVRFTLGAYYDMINGLIGVSSMEWAEKIPDIPIYMFAGGEDPVGDYGRGVAEVYAWLKLTGHDVDMRIYPRDRHECFNEDDRWEVISNIERWLESKL